MGIILKLCLDKKQIAGIATGTVKSIVKGAIFSKIVKKDLLIVDSINSKKSFGHIRLGLPIQIEISEFKMRQSRYGLSNKDRTMKWPNSQKLLNYGIKSAYIFSSPRETTSGELVGLEAHDFAGNVEAFDSIKLTQNSLIDYFKKALAWDICNTRGHVCPFTKKELIDFSARVVHKLTSHGFNFNEKKMNKSTEDFYGKVKIYMNSKDFYLQINPGNLSDRGSEIVLEDFLKKWDSMVLFEDAIQLVGSLANHKRTTGDIDIVIKAETDSDMFKLICWRIERAYPEYAGRFHFLTYGQYSGPFTSNVKLANVIANRNELKINEMSSKIPSFIDKANKAKADDKIVPFKPFFMPKPTHGRQKQEHYTIDSVLETMNNIWTGVENSGKV